MAAGMASRVFALEASAVLAAPLFLPLCSWVAAAVPGSPPRPDTAQSDDLTEHIGFQRELSGSALERSSAQQRRISAVNVKYALTTQLTDALLDVPPSGIQVDVRAGVTYDKFEISADLGLGTDRDRIFAKLVPYDMRATLQTCEDITKVLGVDLFPTYSPFDGQTIPHTAEDTLVQFTHVKFPYGGEFRLCYDAGGSWEELVPKIVVYGAEPLASGLNFWCALSNLNDPQCEENPSISSCHCKGKVEGTGLGLAPAFPSSSMILVDYTESCGGPGAVSPFTAMTSHVSYYEGYEVHNFSTKQPGTGLGMWRLCYCVAYDADNADADVGPTPLDGEIDGPCYAYWPPDFPQFVGFLTTTSVISMEGSSVVTVYPTLRINLVVQCGSDGSSGVGGCSDTDEPRYKLVLRDTKTDLPYYDGDAGCQYLVQAETTIVGAKVFGGHISPFNCEGPITCHDTPETVGPQVPTFNSVQIAASYQNDLMVEAEYDVCYCDRNCQNSQYWFKAGTVQVYTVSAFFSDDRTSATEPSVNIRYYIVIQGDRVQSGSISPGSWSTEADGVTTRELKILKDDDAGNVDSDACLALPQPDDVSGHQLLNGNTDYTQPETLKGVDNKPIGQRYGEICNVDGSSCEPSIKLASAGWYALCYCDSNCNEAPNWAVFGRRLVAGPVGNQIWMKHTGVTFSITVEGYALTEANRILVLSATDLPDMCGTRESTTRVYGPADGPPTMLDSTKQNANIKHMSYHASGTEVTFDKRHYLSDGDQIQLKSVNTPTIAQFSMFNNWHRVFVLCDNDATVTEPACYKVVIPVAFPAAEFPALNDLDSARWFRTSQQTFNGLRIKWDNPTPEGRGYVICWSPSGTTNAEEPVADFVGAVGIVQAKNPLEMPEAFIGLTTVKANPEQNGAPVLLVFTTGDVSAYADPEKQMQLVIAFQPEIESGVYEPSMFPRTRYLTQVDEDVNRNEVSEADQAYCGRLILELWSEDPNGFPMPEGCFYRVDQSAGVDATLEAVPEIHILFSKGNGLRKKTRYMIVLNTLTWTTYRVSKFPIFLFSMDDVHTAADSVIELGRMVPSPDYRVPPRDEDQQLLDWNLGDPSFARADGFRIEPDEAAGTVKELKGYCIAWSAAFPDVTPDPDLYACKPCVTEADCGNFDKSLVFCQSPIQPRCPDYTQATDYPAFEFRLRPRAGSPIKKSTVLRIFLQPFTQWNIDTTCSVIFAGRACPAGQLECGDPACQAEALVGGTPEISTDYPFNTLKITLPQNMNDITNSAPHSFSVGSLSLPAGGFFPESISAEILKEGGTSPDYWQPTNLASVKLYKTPKIIAASLVTAVDPLVNTAPFKGDNDNKLYIRLVSGANMFAYNTGTVQMLFLVPMGYECAQTVAGGVVPDLAMFDGKAPSTKGKFGGDSNREIKYTNSINPIGCAIAFQFEMVLYANSIVYFQLNVDNPDVSMKSDSSENEWKLTVEVTSPEPITLDEITLGSDSYGYCESNPKALCVYKLDSNFGGSVSVLGKLQDVVLQPSVFGANQLNELLVFFTTEQTVGTLAAIETEVWVDAPSTFDFGQYCTAAHLFETYYVPEGRGTTKLPTGDVIECFGALAQAGELTYNRAKISTTGRLLASTAYGFSVKVINSPFYVYSQLNEWRIWTYTKTGVGVDGAYYTARFNEEDSLGLDTSWGIYLMSVPSSNFRVSIADLRPSVGGRTTDIVVLPLVVQMPMDKSVRILAPAGYIWDFEQNEFKYKAAGFGVQESLVVKGAEADLPINYGPNSPQRAPFNRIVLDSIQAAWTPGVTYGFSAKIRLPRLPPTGSANYFSIEFGYDEPLNADRLEAGIAAGPQIQTLINGGVALASSIKGIASVITFSIQTISDIPVGGGIFILGPANFVFEYPLCQPKPAPGFPEMPYDSTCLYEEVPATGQPQVSIVAGESGISAQYYRFSLSVINPPLVMPEGSAGEWVLQTYSLLAERAQLDFNTTIESFPIGDPMLYAGLVMHPKVPCSFQSVEAQLIDSGIPISTCDFEYWQFYPPFGYRDDRPGMPSQLIVAFKLAATVPVGSYDMVLRAPEGYEFDIECDIVTNSDKIFDDSMSTTLAEDSLVNQPVPLDYDIDQSSFESRYTRWPLGALVTQCKGFDNVARITVNSVEAALVSGAPKEDNQNPLPYVFRLGVVANPQVTPTYNKFVLEFNSESSEPFDGVDIWSFTDTAVAKQTTAASTQSMPIMNLVTISLRPVNNVTNGGHLQIFAPSGFAIATECDATVDISAEEKPATLNADSRKWSEFLEGDIVCQGDATPSSRVKIIFPDNPSYGKKLLGGKLYYITFVVQNPQTATEVPEHWEVYSYMDLTTNHLIDSARFPGFTINKAVESFAYLYPSSTNANDEQVITFNLSFPATAAFGEAIQIVAPITFYFGKLGDTACPSYTHLSGSLSLTVPVCAANTITWYLEQESVPAFAPAAFMVQIKNPAETPVINLFRVRHTGADGTRISSRVIDGYHIIPELAKFSVSATVPSTLCQQSAEVVTQQLCQASGSKTQVQVLLTPSQNANLLKISGNVDGESFAFSGASFQGMPVLARSAIAIAAAVDVLAGQPLAITIIDLINPSVSGVSQWSLTTFTTAISTTTPGPIAECGASGVCGLFPFYGARVDESLNKDMFSIYGYINVKDTSQIYPIYLAETSATITWDVRALFAIPANDIILITRPIGYSFLEQTEVVVSPSATGLELGEYGIDFDLKWSTDWEDPEDFFLTISQPLAAGSPIILSFQCALPSAPQATTYWFFRTYAVLPIVDYDGEILDDSVQPYPWSGRALQMTGTNDGAFPGFILVGQLPFQVDTTVQTPSANIVLTMDMDFSDRVDAGSGGTITVLIEAPEGYEFLSQCLKTGFSAIKKCIGQGRVAELTSQTSILSGSSVPVEMYAINPQFTPVPNKWNVKLYTNGGAQYERYSEAPGYKIVTMPVTYKGNNQLGESATGFFTFSPIRTSPTPELYIVVFPPPDQGYNILCTGIEPLGFFVMPECTAGGVNEPVTLMWKNATVFAGVSYTFGVYIYNPGAAPTESQNLFGVSLQHETETVPQAFDANMQIPGLKLKTLPLRFTGLGWSSAAPQATAEVLVQLEVLYEMPAGYVTRIQIRAPAGIMYNEDTAAVEVVPTSVPLKEADGITLAGDVLYLNLDDTQKIDPAIYNIIFSVSNPGTYPNDNSWSITVYKDIDVELTHVTAGYVDGQDSPIDPGGALAGGAVRCGSAMGVAWGLLVTSLSALGVESR